MAGFDEWPNIINDANLNYFNKYEINQVTLREFESII